MTQNVASFVDGLQSMTQKKQVVQPWTAYGLSFDDATESTRLIAFALSRITLPMTVSKAEMAARMFAGNVMLYKYMMNNPHLIKCERVWHSNLLYAKAHEEFHDELEFQGWINEIRKRLGYQRGERNRRAAAKLSAMDR